MRKPLQIKILRRKSQEERRFADSFDLVLQSYSILLQDFLEKNPRLVIGRLRAIRFLFDITPAGTVVVDDIGFSALSPAFTRRLGVGADSSGN